MSEQNRFTCRDEEGRARLMPGVNLIDVIEALCRIEERGQGVLIMPRDEKQVKVSLGLRRACEERRKNHG